MILYFTRLKINLYYCVPRWGGYWNSFISRWSSNSFCTILSSIAAAARTVDTWMVWWWKNHFSLRTGVGMPLSILGSHARYVQAISPPANPTESNTSDNNTCQYYCHSKKSNVVCLNAKGHFKSTVLCCKGGRAEKVSDILTFAKEFFWGFHLLGKYCIHLNWAIMAKEGQAKEK